MARLIEKSEGAVDIGADERVGCHDGAIDVALGCQVHDGLGLMFTQKRGDERGIADVPAYESVAGIAEHGGKIFWITRVSLQVEIDDATAVCDPLQDEIRSNKARAAGDKNAWMRVHDTVFDPLTGGADTAGAV
jgi:hypothetical protein